MAQSTPLEQVQKNRIYSILAADLLRGLENGELTSEDAEESSQFLLGELDPATSEEDAMLIVQTLATRWPIYQTGYFKIKGDILKKEDTQKIETIEKRLQQIAH